MRLKHDESYTFECFDSDEVADNYKKCTLKAPETSRSTEMTFHGRARRGVVQFSPIPFAEQPIGELRFKAPVLKSEYDGPVEGHLGNEIFCVQKDGSGMKGQEDCLYLNIEASQEALENREKLAILYFIHGGGFNGGGGGSRGGAVQNQGVMTVGVNYRLGPMGFTYLNQREDDQEWQGNWGLLDQQMGLKWIHSFAGLFGGDRDQVTITGASGRVSK